MATATRTATVNDPVGIHARPAAEFAQAATVSGCAITIAKQGGNAVNEVWEQMDDMAQQADMSAYEEVIRDHNQRHGDSVSLLTREECEALGISYCNYLWQTTRMTPEEYGEYLEQTWQDTYNR